MNNRFVGLLFFAAALWIGRPDALPVFPVMPVSPVPGDGLHVLVVEDRPNRRDLPPAQLSAMMSAEIDTLVRENNGKKYLYDQKQDVSGKNDPWVTAAMTVPRKSLPWVIIDKDGRGEAVAMPGNLKEYKDLLHKYVK